MKQGFTFSLGLLVGAALAATVVLTSQHDDQSKKNKPYANEQGRSVSSLSAKDVAQLKAGQGWGLAKPAEFNGYPGPAHIIEFADSLALTDEQLKAVTASFDQMKRQAMMLGVRLIDAEKALDAAFVGKRISKQGLSDLLRVAEAVRAELRSVHLAAHLEVTPLLSENQKLKYAELRGYGAKGHSGHGSH